MIIHSTKKFFYVKADKQFVTFDSTLFPRPVYDHDLAGTPSFVLESHVTGDMVEFLLASVKTDEKGRIVWMRFHPDKKATEFRKKLQGSSALVISG